MDRLLLGDNQFFGINHMSEERARSQLLRFQDDRAVIQVLDAAYSLGVTSFMCTTHDRLVGICDHVRSNPESYRDFCFLPCMPYAHKYANAMAESGMLGAVRRFLPDDGFLDAAVRGGRSLAKREIDGLATLLIDSEMTMFRDLQTPVIFLQNIVVDLLVGLGFVDALSIFADHVKQRYGAEPGFITMNLPALLDTLDQAGIANPIVCTSLNRIGFRMSGGVDAYQRALDLRECRVIAMSVFASGAIPAREALEWVCARPALEAIVFGASTKTNIQATRDLVAELWSPTSVS